MPPYWALGFMISRYGYEDLDDMKRVYTGFKEFEIPLVNLLIFLFLIIESIKVFNFIYSTGDSICRHRSL